MSEKRLVVKEFVKPQDLMYHIPSKVNKHGEVFWCKLCVGVVGCNQDTWQNHLALHLKFYSEQLEVLIK